MSPDRSADSPRRDLEILDSEPWGEHAQIDALIELQQQAFEADQDGNPARFGAIVLKMSQIEASINNHAEAIGYAYEAVEAFEKADGHTEETISAYSTIASEHCLMLSPDFCFDSLRETLFLRLNKARQGQDGPMHTVDERVRPLLRLVRSYTTTYLSGRWVRNLTEDKQYPSRYLPGTPRPSRGASERLKDQFDDLLNKPVSLSATQAFGITLLLQTLYNDMSCRRLGLPKPDRKHAKIQGKALAAVTYSLMCKDRGIAGAFQNEGFTIREIADLAVSR